MKLKTLKDIVKRTCNEAGVKEEDCLIDWEELKQEAIKRVKVCKNCKSYADFADCTIESERCIACQRDVWFNSVTEKDLE